MNSVIDNPYKEIGKILLGLLSRNGTPVSEELQDAVDFLLSKLGEKERLGGLCLELPASAENEDRVRLLEEAKLLGNASNALADNPFDVSLEITPFLLDRSKEGVLRIYSRKNFCSESRLADDIRKLCAVKPKDAQAVKTALSKLEGKLSEAIKKGEEEVHKLNELQEKATNLALSEQFSVICGGPGTGKTTAVVNFVEAFLEVKPEAQVVLCAPTGKAQSRLFESVSKPANLGKNGTYYFGSVRKAIEENRLSSMTIHKLLVTELPNGKRPSPSNPLDVDLLVIDESSMIDSALALKLFSVVNPKRTQVVMLGDKRQLAAVGPGSVFADISDKNGILKDRIVELTESIRFKKGSPIFDLAQKILAFEESEKPSLEGFEKAASYTDKIPFEGFKATGLFFEVPKKKLPDAAALWLREKLEKYTSWVAQLRNAIRNSTNFPSLKNLSFEALPQSVQKQLENTWKALETFRPLCAQRQGSIGVNAVNDFCEKQVKADFKVPDFADMYDGKVIIVRKNDSGLGVSNGDVAIIFGIKENGADKKTWFAYIGDLKKVIPAQLLPTYDCAFAITIHQSQGSGFDDVAVFLPAQVDASSDAASLCTRELLYTGITRSKKTCQIFGSREALEQSIKTVTHRTGGLPERLKERFSDEVCQS